MGKNLPITARVNKGLFNQKAGVKEPLLNVGPAGVYGNNATSDAATKSPAKRGYSQGNSPFKKESAAQERKNLNKYMPIDDIAGKSPLKQDSENKPVEVVSTSERDPDETEESRDANVVDKTVEKESVSAYRRACGGTKDGTTKTDPKTGKKFKCAQAKKGEEPVETTTIKSNDCGADEELKDGKCVKKVKSCGEGEELKDGKCVKKVKDNISMRDEGDALSAQNIRENLRGGKVANRNVKKYQRKIDNIGDIGEDDGSKAWKRKKRKLEAAKANLANARGASRGSQMQNEQSRHQNRGDAKTEGSFKDDSSTRIVKNADVSVASQADIDAKKAALAGVSVDDLAGTSGPDIVEIADNPDATAKKTSKFFKKAGPMKVKYFGK